MQDIGRKRLYLFGKDALHLGRGGSVGDTVDGNNGDAECLDLGDQRRILGEDDAVFESLTVCLLELIAKKSARSADIRIGQNMRDLDLS